MTSKQAKIIKPTSGVNPATNQQTKGNTMTNSFARIRFAFLCLTLVSTLVSSAGAADYETLFNGRDLAGWKGLESFWSVVDGAIVEREAYALLDPKVQAELPLAKVGPLAICLAMSCASFSKASGAHKRLKKPQAWACAPPKPRPV